MARSAGEAGLFGAVKGAGVLMGAVSLARDLDLDARGVLRADSPAARGFGSRRSLGKVKDVGVRALRIQDVLRPGRSGVAKIPGGENAADVTTRCLNGASWVRRGWRAAQIRAFCEEWGRTKGGLRKEIESRKRGAAHGGQSSRGKMKRRVGRDTYADAVIMS